MIWNCDRAKGESWSVFLLHYVRNSALFVLHVFLCRYGEGESACITGSHCYEVHLDLLYVTLAVA